MDDFDRVIRIAGGICTTGDFREAGVSSRRLRAAVDAGTLVRVRRGVYASADVPSDRLLGVRLGGRLAGLSAAASYGLWDGWESSLHIVVPRNSHLTPQRTVRDESGHRTIAGRDVTLHWHDDALDASSRWRVSHERCLRQVLRWHDVETALAVVESALTQRLLEPDGLKRVAAGLQPTLERAVSGARPGAQSGLETIVRLRLESLGFVAERQAAVRGVGRVDLRVIGTRVIVEVDGYAFHSARRQFAEDRRRDAEAAAQGLVALRFTAEQVRHEWPWAERMVLATVAAYR